MLAGNHDRQKWLPARGEREKLVSLDLIEVFFGFFLSLSLFWSENSDVIFSHYFFGGGRGACHEYVMLTLLKNCNTIVDECFTVIVNVHATTFCSVILRKHRWNFSLHNSFLYSPCQEHNFGVRIIHPLSSCSLIHIYFEFKSSQKITDFRHQTFDFQCF